jgi:hypothetical protein
MSVRKILLVKKLALVVLQKSNRAFYEQSLSTSFKLPYNSQGSHMHHMFYLILILPIRTSLSFSGSLSLLASFSALLQIYGFALLYMPVSLILHRARHHIQITVLFFIMKIIHDAIYDILIFPGGQAPFPDMIQISSFVAANS